MNRKELRMPFPITVDGHGGAGKTTLIERLSRKLAIPILPVDTLIDHTIYEIRKTYTADIEHKLTHVLHHLTSIKIAQSDYERWWRDGAFLVDEFWNPLIQLWAKDKYLSNPNTMKIYDSSNGDKPQMFAFFRQIINMNEGYEPSLSFFLDISSSDSDKRVAFRTLSEKELVMDKTAVSSDPSKQDEQENRDEAFEQSISFLDTTLPYFHVIDGRLPPNAIFDKVVDAIKQAQ